jgi:DNA-binding NtrC family response regulator
MENELFGHERGAFTDASNSRAGLIQEAEGGTLFLDEIDALLPLAQVKLLRFLQEKEYRALGSNKVRKADVRVITASNANLEAAVAGGQLRSDFYYRLSTVQIVLPPLRERRDDIPLFANALLSRYAAQYNKKIDAVSPEALLQLLLYHWPGNVRELEHVIERAVVMSEDSIIRECDVSLRRPENQARREGFKEAKEKIVEQFEKSYVQGMLVAFQGNITKAARAANKNRRAFWQLIRKHGIDVHSFKSTASS